MINNDSIAKIRLSVTNNSLRIIKNLTATTKMVNCVKVEFEFRTEDWDTLIKTVVFTRLGVEPKLVLLPEGTTSCLVPWEILDMNNDGTFEIGVFGIGVDGERLPTHKVAIKIRKGCYVKGTTLQTPTPGIYDQLEELLSGNITVSQLINVIEAYCTDAKFITLDDIPTAEAIDGTDNGYVRADLLHRVATSNLHAVDARCIALQESVTQTLDDAKAYADELVSWGSFD